MAPNKTEIKVTMIYAETEPNHTEKGLPDFAAIPIPTSCVLSANSAKKTALKVIQNIFQSIFPPNGAPPKGYKPLGVFHKALKAGYLKRPNRHPES
jgi:hypothetical protein